jgi:PAS domain S-box-containing protein
VKHEDRFAASLSEEGRYRLLIEAVTDYAIYMLDADGIVTSWNPGAQRFKGYTADQIIGHHFSRFYTEEDRARSLPERALRAASEEGRFENEGWRLRKDGSRFWAHVIIDPVRSPSGELIGFAKITRDLTERRELELAREALFQSQKMEAVGQLTGGIAHDFNNLLMAILGSLELAKKRLPDDPQLLRLIDNAVQGAKRGSSLTQRMLSFARRQALEPKPLDLPELVRNMLELLERSIGPSITIETRMPMRMTAVQADQNQLEMALMNLIVNARDAMPQGGAIHIVAEEEKNPSGLAPGKYVRLSIRDEGEGMDDETLARAVEPFFTTKGVGKGTGLGLPMVHGMAAQTGGQFELKSRKGEGTEALLWLPAASGAAPAEAAVKIAAGDGAKALTVLAVDDDTLVLFNTTAMLEDLGHTVLEARSGREALEILQSQAVDLVVTDQAMPQMTGVQLADAIRSQWPDMPVILATGYAELPGGVGKELPRLAKPFDEAALAAAIAQNVA